MCHRSSRRKYNIWTRRLVRFSGGLVPLKNCSWIRDPLNKTFAGTSLCGWACAMGKEAGEFVNVCQREPRCPECFFSGAFRLVVSAA